MNSGTVRIRLVFEEGQLLSKSHRKNGLKRSWILLKSHLLTIFDFSSYLLDFFLLRSACPDGLILSMDGFVLPPFEPTSILKDKDIVRVKKNEDNVAAVDKMEELVNKCTDYKNEADADDEPYDLPRQLEDTLYAGSVKKTVSSKRKALKTLHSSKMMKKRVVPTSKCLQFRTEHNGRFQQEVFLSEKSLVKKHKSSNGHTDTNVSNKQKLQKFFSSPEKDKRQMMRKQVKTQKKKVQQQRVEKSNGKLPDENYFKDSEQLAGSSDDEEIVPVVIRPGHVRFLSLGQVPAEANQIVHPAQASIDTIRLNGMAIKNVRNRGQRKSSSWTSNCKNREGQSSKPQAKKGLATMNHPIDFNKLKPCANLPKRGDIIAYRLIELSSTWTPELSSFRVGKVSWCKPEANKIMVIPVPEYPFVYKAMNDESVKHPYAEDGSLKTDYSSLVDIRIVEHKNSVGFEAAAGNISEASGTKQRWNQSGENHSTAPNQSWNKWGENHPKPPKQNWKKWEDLTSVRGNGKENAWDEILQAFSAKKANLSYEVRWRTGEKKAWEGAHDP